MAIPNENEKKQRGQKTQGKRPRKMTEYGRQLNAKQEMKEAYGVRERQFRRFFEIARKSQGAAGEALLVLLERRIDNVIYRLKFATSRAQARQLVVHGHVLLNGKKVYSPSLLVDLNDEISLVPAVSGKDGFKAQVIEKRLKTNVKVPDWLEAAKGAYSGRVLRFPVRDDVNAQFNEQAIVELYSK